MSPRLVASALVLILGATCAHAEQIYCDLAIRAAEAGKLQSYSDKMIEQSLCTTATAAADAVNVGDWRKQGACIVASRYLLREFERRWPGRDSRTVIGEC
jgi:hypothetical protein